MKAKKLIALLPIRANSSRVLQKNTRLLCGRPLFHWILDVLSRSCAIERIVVDTDCEKIARDATNHFDVTILMRPDHLRGEMIGINELIEHQIAQLDGEYFLQTHATNPFLTVETIDRAAQVFFGRKKVSSLFSVTPFRKRFYWPDGRPVNHDPENLLRTQDLSPIFEENSCIYMFTRKSFLKKKHRIGEDPQMLQMEPLESVDIDDPEDFLYAEFLMTRKLECLRG